ncbi:uncharacterized protein LOC122298843 [Carya illinoinensis]|uniref:uncharacterized protein LOC122298843 n=1 Tax=Carya illinoinensis TaxID=32201 RepID=UPI001C727253|nr:uncharacterized protein LOC122298843 [Carya illinoinensis]
MKATTATSGTDWRQPPQDWFKVNWDGAINKAQGTVGVGVVIRDSQGMVIATQRQRKSLFTEPLLAESYGALIAVNFAWDLGLANIILEGDSLQVVQALKKDQEAWCSSSMFLFKAKLGLSKFARWEVSHVRRDGNIIAHLLAKNALSILDYITTMEEYRLCILRSLE